MTSLSPIRPRPGRSPRRRAVVMLLVAATAAPLLAATPRDLYTAALVQERQLRTPTTEPADLEQWRHAIADYQDIVRQYPRSGYSDNALWQAAGLAAAAYEHHRQATERDTGIALLRMLEREYPSSALVPRIQDRIAQFQRLDQSVTQQADPPDPVKHVPRPFPQRDVSVPPVSPSAGEAAPVAPTVVAAAEIPLSDEAIGGEPVDLLPLPEGWAARRLDPIPPLSEREASVAADAVPAPEPALSWPRMHELLYPHLGAAPALVVSPARPMPEEPAVVDAPLDVTEVTSPVPPAGAALAMPSANGDGDFSIGRQLGLGVSRIVIDPGHGGYDPGAQTDTLAESALVLDIARRLETRLKRETDIEVILTRRQDDYVPLRARTELANRVRADLFLSIHANASKDRTAGGIETYYLDLASDPGARAVAARENAAVREGMHQLPALLESISRNNKLDESRDFATLVQRNLLREVRALHPGAEDLGVKQAPFVVLIGANMPSVLAEISFLTNQQDAALLATEAYRDQIADALLNGVLDYQRALKPTTSFAADDDN